MEIGPAAGADVELADLAAGATSHADLGLADLLEDDPCFLQHQLTGTGQLDAAGLTPESGAPISFSSCRICRVSGGWLMPSVWPR
jgi:hypothetical protein